MLKIPYRPIQVHNFIAQLCLDVGLGSFRQITLKAGIINGRLQLFMSYYVDCKTEPCAGCSVIAAYKLVPYLDQSNRPRFRNCGIRRCVLLKGCVCVDPLSVAQLVRARECVFVCNRQREGESGV